MSNICNRCHGDSEINKCSCRICINNNSRQNDVFNYCRYELNSYHKRKRSSRIISICVNFEEDWEIKLGIACKK